MNMLHRELNAKIQMRRRYYIAEQRVQDRLTGRTRSDIRVLIGNLVVDEIGNRALYNPILDRWERYGAH